MKKRFFLWTLYFLVAASVIAAAINAGRNHGDCNECRNAYTYLQVSDKFMQAEN